MRTVTPENARRDLWSVRGLEPSVGSPGERPDPENSIRMENPMARVQIPDWSFLMNPSFSCTGIRRNAGFMIHDAPGDGSGGSMS